MSLECCNACACVQHVLKFWSIHHTFFVCYFASFFSKIDLRLYNTNYFLVIYLLIISQRCWDRTNNMTLCKTQSSQMLRQTLITDELKIKTNYIHGIPMHIGTVCHKICGHTLRDKLFATRYMAMRCVINGLPQDTLPYAA